MNSELKPNWLAYIRTVLNDQKYLYIFVNVCSIIIYGLQELDKQIVDYTSTYEPDDQLEWSLVLEEIKSFIKADGIVSVLHADSNTIVLSHR